MDGQWHFAVAPYVWFAGLNGDVSVRGLPDVPIDESFSDIWESFHFGFLAHFEGRKDRWGFATDIMYMRDLRSPVAAGAAILGQLGLEAIVKSVTAEGARLLPRGERRAQRKPRSSRRAGRHPVLPHEPPLERDRSHRRGDRG